MNLKFNSDSLTGTIDLPSSKSISNRILMIQALCLKRFDIYNLSTANDTVLLNQLLEKIKVGKSQLTLDIEDAGTPFRFLTAFCAVQEGKEFTLIGSERMKQRPIHDLVEVLNNLGADISYLDKDGYPNLFIKGRRVKGGSVKISAKTSSQFISSLCLIAPILDHGLTIEMTDEIVSNAYIQMTLDIMKEFGIVSIRNKQCITINHQSYQSRDYTIENDWSSATFFYGMAMLINKVDLKLKGLYEQSLQGDSFIHRLANDFGIETIFKNDVCIIHRMKPINEMDIQIYNFLSHPDLAVPMIVAFAIQYPNLQISGIHHLELKESKRITLLQSQLEKIGIHLNYSNELLTFHSKSEIKDLSNIIPLTTCNDHRIAMSLSLLTLKGWLVSLDDTLCVKKSFPDFFNQIDKIGIIQY